MRTRPTPTPITIVLTLALLFTSGCASLGSVMSTLANGLRANPAVAVLDVLSTFDRGAAGANAYFGLMAERDPQAAQRAREFQALVTGLLRAASDARVSLDDGAPVTSERINQETSAARQRAEALRLFLESLDQPTEISDAGLRAGHGPSPEDLRVRADALRILAAAGRQTAR